MPRSVYYKNKESLDAAPPDFSDTFTRAIQDEPELPDIVTFAEHPGYCNKRLYPRQKTILRLIYLDTEHMTDYDRVVIDEWAQNFYMKKDREGVSPDIWARIAYLKEHGYYRFREIEFIGGRRGGKGHIGGIIAAYESWRMILLDNPQEFYGVDPSKDLYFFTTATNIQQAKDFLFADCSNTIIGAKCFEPYLHATKNYALLLQTPADKRRIAYYESRKVRVEKDIASLRIMAMSSNSRAGRGAAAFGLFFDEFAHMLSATSGPATAEELYKALKPSLDQFGKDGLIYIPSSPYSKAGKAYDLYLEGLATEEAVGIDGVMRMQPVNPEVLILQLPSWSPYVSWNDPVVTNGKPFKSAPQLYDDLAKREERRDPESFKVEKRAQWAEVINAYLNPTMVDRMFQPFIDSTSETRILDEQKMGVLAYQYRGHADPSKAGHNFAACIAHTEPVADPETGDVWEHVILDWLKVWRPQDYPENENQIPYDEIEDELAEVILRFPTMKAFTYDQFGSFATVSMMKKRLRQAGHRVRVREFTHTAKSNQEVAERFKAALGMSWAHAYRDTFGNEGGSLLEWELKFLQDMNGKVKAQTTGPVTTDDAADCWMVAVSELLADQLDRFHRRERLSQVRVAPGAEQGYHSHSVDPDSTRAKLGRHATHQSKKQRFGVW